MDIQKDAVYTIKDAMRYLDRSKRTVQRMCLKNRLKKIDGHYIINGATLIEWRNKINEKEKKKAAKTTQPRHQTATPRKQQNTLKIEEAREMLEIAAAKEGKTYATFTYEQWDEINAKMAIVDLQEEQINYLRERIEKQDKIIASLHKSIEQRNYIEVKSLNKEN